MMQIGPRNTYRFLSCWSKNLWLLHHPSECILNNVLTLWGWKMCNKRQKCETMSFSIQTKELFSCTFKGTKEILVILQKAKKKRHRETTISSVSSTSTQNKWALESRTTQVKPTDSWMMNYSEVSCTIRSNSLFSGKEGTSYLLFCVIQETFFCTAKETLFFPLHSATVNCVERRIRDSMGLKMSAIKDRK